MAYSDLTLRREGLSISDACEVAGIGRTKIYQAITDGPQGAQVRRTDARFAGRFAGLP